ncbi:hypothetical protein QAD02_013182 [Eretmocerus hayati]|uniref:Uncharacterized protein n=1 Tax=Eretmocerus hayati TaxID=131215 RepID=A0ACC2P1D2_9HYME|nr:hypothetical protein QAD02_013182 [Eretmocerus hayati]
MDQDSRRIRKTLSMRFARKAKTEESVESATISIGASADIDNEGSKKSGTKRKCEEMDNDDENSIKACAKLFTKGNGVFRNHFQFLEKTISHSKPLQHMCTWGHVRLGQETSLTCYIYTYT